MVNLDVLDYFAMGFDPSHSLWLIVFPVFVECCPP